MDRKGLWIDLISLPIAKKEAHLINTRDRFHMGPSPNEALSIINVIFQIPYSISASTKTQPLFFCEKLLEFLSISISGTLLNCIFFSLSAAS